MEFFNIKAKLWAAIKAKCLNFKIILEFYPLLEFYNLDEGISLIDYKLGPVESNYFIDKMDYILITLITNYNIGNNIDVNIGHRLRYSFAGNFRNYIVNFSFNVYLIEIFINVT